MRTAFLIAAHYPPATAVGAQRTIHLALSLLDHGWKPVVLTIAPRAMDQIDEQAHAESPIARIETVRSFCLNTRRDFSLKGRYLDWLTVPDHWWPWQWFVRADLKRLLAQTRPDILWSTFPVASAHLIAARLKRELGVPWVADFRDPAIGLDAPPSGLRGTALARMESRVAQQADHLTFASHSAARQIFAPRHGLPASRLSVIPNGFDAALLKPGALAPLPSEVGANATRQTDAARPLTFLHSGHIYADIRNPTGLLQALHRIKTDSPEIYSRIRVRFRGSSRESFIESLLAQIPVREAVELLPPISHAQALAEMRSVDGLILIQRSQANCQVPAKLYEYLVMNQPILGLVDPEGDTADVLRQVGVSQVAHPDDPAQIARVLVDCVRGADGQRSLRPDAARLSEHTRQARSQQFVELFERLCPSGPSAG